MPVVKDESSEKRESIFLKYEPENLLRLLSHLYKVPFHYLNGLKKSVACREKDCVFCKAGEDKKFEYNYYVSLNGQEGVLNVKPSVFFAIQAISKASKKESRQIKWLVIKEGQGLDTDYTVSKDDNLTVEEFAKVKESLDSYTEKLVKVMKVKEELLERNYIENVNTPDGEMPSPGEELEGIRNE